MSIRTDEDHVDVPAGMTSSQPPKVQTTAVFPAALNVATIHDMHEMDQGVVNMTAEEFTARYGPPGTYARVVPGPEILLHDIKGSTGKDKWSWPVQDDNDDGKADEWETEAGRWYAEKIGYLMARCLTMGRNMCTHILEAYGQNDGNERFATRPEGWALEQIQTAIQNATFCEDVGSQQCVAARRAETGAEKFVPMATPPLHGLHQSQAEDGSLQTEWKWTCSKDVNGEQEVTPAYWDDFSGPPGVQMDLCLADPDCTGLYSESGLAWFRCTGAIMEYTIGSDHGSASSSPKDSMYAAMTHLAFMRKREGETFLPPGANDTLGKDMVISDLVGFGMPHLSVKYTHGYKKMFGCSGEHDTEGQSLEAASQQCLMNEKCKFLHHKISYEASEGTRVTDNWVLCFGASGFNHAPSKEDAGTVLPKVKVKFNTSASEYEAPGNDALVESELLEEEWTQTFAEIGECSRSSGGTVEWVTYKEAIQKCIAPDLANGELRGCKFITQKRESSGGEAETAGEFLNQWTVCYSLLPKSPPAEGSLPADKAKVRVMRRHGIISVYGGFTTTSTSSTTSSSPPPTSRRRFRIQLRPVRLRHPHRSSSLMLSLAQSPAQQRQRYRLQCPRRQPKL
ncbi:unnamed protein product [Amoebophrya sp. A25]|nr:unnamed protein product [Amoebophrya sp. A25]|eukprot:GSA25T00017821001.1